jgi:predicted ATPase
MSIETNFFSQFTQRLPGRLERLNVSGFRRLRAVSMEMRPLCVLIGANGCGKTSMLDVLSLLGHAAQGRLAIAMNELGGLQSVLSAHQSDAASENSLAQGLPLPQLASLSIEITRKGEAPHPHALDYSLNMQPLGPGYMIEREALDGIDEHGVTVEHFHTTYGTVWTPGEVGQPRKRTEKQEPFETVLSSASPTDDEAWSLRIQLASAARFDRLYVGPRSAVRMPQPLQLATLPGKNGEDLVSCLYNMRESYRDRFDAVEDALRAAFPGFERLDFPPVAAGTLALTWRDRAFRNPLYMHQLSEGTLRFLWLATLLQSPGLPAIILIDEPEVSLHPELLSLLADLMREASTRTQLIVATHADRLVRFLKPEEVVVMDIEEDGSASAKWGDSLDLEEWLKDYTLDQLWQMGRLGGRA